MLVYWISYLPLLIVWLVGAILAIARWPRHTYVSALVLGCIGAMVTATLGWRIGMQLLARPNIGGISNQTQIAYGLLAIGNSLLRTIAWAAMLTAVFGWRSHRRPKGDLGSLPFQFTIRSLLILTLCIALFCAASRIVVRWLGESAVFLVTLIDDIPILGIWLGGAWLAIVRWQWRPPVSGLTLAAILLSLGAFAMGQGLMLYFTLGGTTFSPSNTFIALNAVLGLIAPIVWSLLLVAAFGWREELPSQFTVPAPPA